ncbi:hypothetical protein ACGFZA_20765 [Streptomyces sp. NPDC048211]|uniref:hypothetical protein n=1 Tax=Streptomyces sp. NPDC048211 TaxID=3365516 RepID=UPI0037122350
MPRFFLGRAAVAVRGDARRSPATGHGFMWVVASSLVPGLTTGGGSVPPHSGLKCSAQLGDESRDARVRAGREHVEVRPREERFAPVLVEPPLVNAVNILDGTPLRQVGDHATDVPEPGRQRAKLERYGETMFVVGTRPTCTFPASLRTKVLTRRSR